MGNGDRTHTWPSSTIAKREKINPRTQILIKRNGDRDYPSRGDIRLQAGNKDN